MKAENDVVRNRRYDFLECGQCGYLHRIDYYGDCRNDDERFAWEDIPDESRVLDLTAQLDPDE